MNQQEAKQTVQEPTNIFKEYNQVLKSSTKEGLLGPLTPAPLSVLPYPKDIIKKAIKTCLIELKSANQLDKQNKLGSAEQLYEPIKENLKVAYISLANFVDDALAESVIDTAVRINEVKNMRIEETKQMFKLGQQPDIKKYNEYLKASQDERDNLLNDIKEFVINLENKSTNQNTDKDLYSQTNVSKVANSTIARILLAPFEFLNSLMHKSYLLKVKINFRNLYGPDNYDVEYETTKFIPNPTNRDLIQLFSLYYSKTLYNMAQVPNCGVLIKIMKDVTTNDFRERKNKLTEHINNRAIELDKPELLKELKTMEKEYGGKLHGDLNKIEQRYITTDIAWGAENYYLPLSVLVFLSDLMNKMEINDTASLCTCVQGINDYFDKNGYSKLSSVNESVMFGLEQAGLIDKKVF